MGGWWGSSTGLQKVVCGDDARHVPVVAVSNPSEVFQRFPLTTRLEVGEIYLQETVLDQGWVLPVRLSLLA